MTDDIMDLHTGHGCARLAKYINPKTGRREDAAHRYIHTQSHNRRLHILTKTLVTRVLFDKNKAIGVEVIGNENQDPAADQTPRKIIARKLVVVSAGAIGSPIVLQRSGLGEASRLSKLGIDVVVDLPGVGANYEDHNSCIIPYHVPDDVETIDPVMEQNKEVIETYLAQFANGKGFLTTNLNDAGSRLRPTVDELKEIGPAFSELWKRQFEPAPDKAVFVQTILNGFIGPRSAVPKGSRFMMVANILAYPVSSGHVYITSADPYSPPDFHAGFLEDQADLEAHVWMYKKSREIFRRIQSYRGEYAPLHPRFPTGSSAGCVRLEKAHPQGIEDLVYTEEDNAALEDWVRERSDTTWHSVGSVQMKPKENGGCVDSRLNVYGTINLKVADLSILPSNVGANTYSTALLVGEKAALMIAKDLGINIP
ncbi:Alcohol oxidase OS=Pichia angusta GN=MOX PE=3 SV=1 [Rhizoctonia solani AG-1 IB]|uniref:Alcohol oxidase n=1 Tax=Thanatephorus cucumeris (strain AG1-IB / isolate 7/3/14) TaxID=1108050 RepID=A0A0B7FAV2_THACB|nr:Alcohol oxidase OS=Pichia angusta GN=MOX PE=3 SV=1 [Rhizoctonia solani AG-1 IB]